MPNTTKLLNKRLMSDLNRIKPAFRTKGAVTGNFGRQKVKGGSTLSDLGLTKAKTIRITTPQEYERRLLEALSKTENPNVISTIEDQLRSLRTQRGEGQQRVDRSARTAQPFHPTGT